MFLDLVGFFFGNAFLNFLRSAFDKFFRFFQTQASDGPNFFNNVDFLVTNRGENDVKFVFLGRSFAGDRMLLVGAPLASAVAPPEAGELAERIPSRRRRMLRPGPPVELWDAPLLPVAVIIAAWLFLPRFRQGNTTSAYEFLEQRYGPSVRVYGALAFMLAQLVRLATILYLLALLIQEVVGLDPVQAIWMAGVFVALYTVIGGIDAVIWTDVMQTLVLLIGGIVCLVVIIDLVPGGLAAIWDKALADHKLSFADRTGNLIDYLAALEKDEGGNGANPEFARSHGIVIHVHLGDRDFTFIFVSQFFDHGADCFTGAAPWRPEIYQHRQCRVGNMFFKCRQGCFYGLSSNQIILAFTANCIRNFPFGRKLIHCCTVRTNQFEFFSHFLFHTTY